MRNTILNLFNNLLNFFIVIFNYRTMLKDQVKNLILRLRGCFYSYMSIAFQYGGNLVTDAKNNFNVHNFYHTNHVVL